MMDWTRLNGKKRKVKVVNVTCPLQPPKSHANPKSIYTSNIVQDTEKIAS